MKTIILTVVALVFAGSITSCKKDYTCACSKTYTTSTGSTTYDDYSAYTYNDNRKRAEDRCNANNTQGKDLGGSYSINCHIK